MKLFSIATLSSFVLVKGEWDVNFPDFDFDESDEGFQMFKAEEAHVYSIDSGLEVGIGQRGKVGTANESIKKMQLRKYETLKKMILILHDSDDREWGRYCPYGCHCMVNGPTDLLSGHGQPVDEVDSACKRHQECISCAMKDFGADVCPWWKPYKMSAMVDDVTNEKHFICQDEPGFCKRSLCECDAQLARDLYSEREHYDRDNHHRYGSFSKDQCRSVNRDTGNESISGEKQVKMEGHMCCGANPKRVPYSVNKQDCCNNQLEAIGTC